MTESSFERARRALGPYLAELQAGLRMREEPNTPASVEEDDLPEGRDVIRRVLPSLLQIPAIEGGEGVEPAPEELAPVPVIDESEQVQELPEMEERNPASRPDDKLMRWYLSQMQAKRASSPLKFEVTPSSLGVSLNLGHGARQDALTRQTGENSAPVIQGFWAPYVQKLLKQSGESPSPETLRLIEDQLYDAFSSPSQHYDKPKNREIA